MRPATSASRARVASPPMGSSKTIPSSAPATIVSRLPRPAICTRAVIPRYMATKLMPNRRPARLDRLFAHSPLQRVQSLGTLRHYPNLLLTECAEPGMDYGAARSGVEKTLVTDIDRFDADNSGSCATTLATWWGHNRNRLSRMTHSQSEKK